MLDLMHLSHPANNLYAIKKKEYKDGGRKINCVCTFYWNVYFDVNWFLFIFNKILIFN